MEQAKNFDVAARPGRWSDGEREEFAKLNEGDVDMMLYMKGIEPGSSMHNYYSGMHEVLRIYTAYAEGGVGRDAISGEIKKYKNNHSNTDV